MRLAALFHHIGKPIVYTVDDNNIGHFYNQWTKSNQIFIDLAQKYNLEQNLIKGVSKLIFYHDLSFEKLENE